MIISLGDNNGGFFYGKWRWELLIKLDIGVTWRGLLDWRYVAWILRIGINVIIWVLAWEKQNLSQTCL